MDEETFIRSFEDVPKIQLYSARELEEHLTIIRSIIQDPINDWSKRAEAVLRFIYFYFKFFLYRLSFVMNYDLQLKKIRSLIIAGAASYDELWHHIRLLEHAFQTSVKDLRFYLFVFIISYVI